MITQPQIRALPFGSVEQQQAVELRQQVLRTPIGLRFTAEELAAEHDQHHYGLYVDEALAACAIWLAVNENMAKIRQMAVHPDYQQQGLGTALIRHLIHNIRIAGYQQICLHARMEAVPFYERIGFAAEGAPFIEVGVAHRRMVMSLQN